MLHELGQLLRKAAKHGPAKVRVLCSVAETVSGLAYHNFLLLWALGVGDFFYLRRCAGTPVVGWVVIWMHVSAAVFAMSVSRFVLDHMMVAKLTSDRPTGSSCSAGMRCCPDGGCRSCARARSRVQLQSKAVLLNRTARQASRR